MEVEVELNAYNLFGNTFYRISFAIHIIVRGEVVTMASTYYFCTTGKKSILIVLRNVLQCQEPVKYAVQNVEYLGEIRIHPVHSVVKLREI